MSDYEIRVYPNRQSPKLFKNRVLEYLTKTHPLIIDGMYIIIASGLIRYYYLHVSTDVRVIVAAFFGGYFTWTLIEYLLHRFLYHKIEDATYSTGIQYVFHGIHHEYPSDQDRLILPPIPSLAIAFLLFTLFYLFMGKLAFVFAPGVMIGYITYMTIHYTVHKIPSPKRFNFWWRHHNIHHYQQHDRAFGVTTSLWDRIFGTMPEPNRKTITIKYEK